MAFSRPWTRLFIVLAWCAVFFAGASPAAAVEPPQTAAEEYDPFSDANRADAKPKEAEVEYDPFSDENRADAKPAQPTKVPDLTRGLEQARKEGKRVFLDFTGETCVNCKINERTVFPQPAVRDLLRKYVVVHLYTDIVPKTHYSAEQLASFGENESRQRREDAAKNMQLMTEGFKTGALPLYVILAPTADGYKEVDRYAKGRINDVNEFTGFLKRGLAATAPAPTPEKPVLEKKAPATAELIDFDVKVAPASAKPGEVVRVTITGKPRPGYHTYPVGQRTPDQPPSGLSSLTYNQKALKPLWPVEESKPEFVYESAAEAVWLEYKDQFTWSQDVLIDPDAEPGTYPLGLSVRVQVCNEGQCVWGTHEFNLPVEVTPGTRAPLSEELKKRAEAKEPEPTVVAVPSEVEGRLLTGKSAKGGTGLLAFILQGVFWGAISLVTPCVFPMIPITVSFFLKKSEQEHHRPLLTALIYCGTIVVVLTIAAVALLSVFREWSTSALMNFALGALFVYFALSLLGMYEIELPSGLARFTSSREGQGIAGTMFMALTFTIISFACVAPFLGGFGGTAATANLGFTKMLLGGLAFSLTFAAPFLVLALFPSLLKKMPKSGTWLNSVKVVMGFLELAAALKFFRTGELLWSAEPQFFTYDTVMALYVAICFLAGAYLLYLYRLPHDTPVENLGVLRVLFALLFLGLGIYLLPAMWKANDKGVSQRPSGVVFAWLDSFLLPDPVEDLPWTKYLVVDESQLWGGEDLPPPLRIALKNARDKNSRVFVDFTGKSCTNCKFNEREVFTEPEVRELLLKYELVSLYTDLVPNHLYPSKVRRKFDGGTARQEADAQRNLQSQRDVFNDERLPLYVILEPTGDRKYREVARYEEGKINDVGAFVEFLESGLPPRQK